MGFFKNLKEDFSQAVNELLPEEELLDLEYDKELEGPAGEEVEEQGPYENDTLLQELLKEYEEKERRMEMESLGEVLEEVLENEDDKGKRIGQAVSEKLFQEEPQVEAESDIELLKEPEVEAESDNDPLEEPEEETPVSEQTEASKEVILDEKSLNDNKENLEDEKMAALDEKLNATGAEALEDDNVDMELITEVLNEEEKAPKAEETKRVSAFDESAEASDDVTIITKGTRIIGNIISDSSLQIDGTVTGDIECLGKLSINGLIEGNSSAAEVVVSSSRVEGNITSIGNVELSAGTVVIGDVEGESALIAGAVKGQIDINGPVIVDSTAIVKGDIKAKSVQVNNGAVIDGHYSLSYAAVDIDSFFSK